MPRRPAAFTRVRRRAKYSSLNFPEVEFRFAVEREPGSRSQPRVLGGVVAHGASVLFIDEVAHGRLPDPGTDEILSAPCKGLDILVEIERSRRIGEALIDDGGPCVRTGEIDHFALRVGEVARILRMYPQRPAGRLHVGYSKDRRSWRRGFRQRWRFRRRSCRRVNLRGLCRRPVARQGDGRGCHQKTSTINGQLLREDDRGDPVGEEGWRIAVRDRIRSSRHRTDPRHTLS